MFIRVVCPVVKFCAAVHVTYNKTFAEQAACVAVTDYNTHICKIHLWMQSQSLASVYLNLLLVFKATTYNEAKAQRARSFVRDQGVVIAEQRRWMSPSGRTKRKGQPFKKEARSAGRRVALSPPPAAGMTASRSSKPERAVSPLKQPAEFTDDNM